MVTEGTDVAADSTAFAFFLESAFRVRLLQPAERQARSMRGLVDVHLLWYLAILLRQWRVSEIIDIHLSFYIAFESS